MVPNAKNLSQIKSPYNINVSAIPEYVNRRYRGLKCQSSPALSQIARLTFQARLDFWRQRGSVAAWQRGSVTAWQRGSVAEWSLAASPKILELEL